MGLPEIDRGGPPGGGGMGRPEALVGAWAGADGGVGAPPVACTGAAGRGPAGAVGRAAVGAAAAGAAGRAAAAGGPGAAGAAGLGATGLGVAGLAADAAGAGAAGAAGAGGAGAAAAGAIGATGAGAGAGATGAGAAGALAAGAAGATGGRDIPGAAAAGCSEAGRLVMSRAPERLTGAGLGELAGAEPPTPVSSGPDGSPPVRSGDGPPAVAGSAGTAFLVPAAFLAGAAGSSGCTGRRRPSRSAFRRARSACASSMDDEWLLTPIPRDRQRSSASLLVRPSS
jgi:hypothetical protein